MAGKFCIILTILCALHAANGFGLMTGLITQATSQFQSTLNTVQNAITGSGDKADKLLKKFKYQTSNPEGINGLVKEINMSISDIIPADNTVDLTSCFSAQKPNISDMVQKAGQGAQACYNKADKELDPYKNNVAQTVDKMNQIATQSQADLASCILHLGGIALCTAKETQKLYDARDRFMSNDNYDSAAEKITAEFKDCSINVQDQAIATSVSVIREARQCIRDKIGAATNNSAA